MYLIGNQNDTNTQWNPRDTEFWNLKTRFILPNGRTGLFTRL